MCYVNNQAGPESIKPREALQYADVKTKYIHVNGRARQVQIVK